MDPRQIIFKHYRPDAHLTRILLDHSQWVTSKALAVAESIAHLNPDKTFIAEAAMLHDIGIYQTNKTKLGCHGPHPYVCHGYLGRQILEAYDLPAHALVCERHVGAGLTKKDIVQQQLPLPAREMLPLSLEEKIICYADKFFSKTNGASEHSVQDVLTDLSRFGEDKVNRFLEWHWQFTQALQKNMAKND